MSNDTTRRYPRTLTEAFGPYANGSELYAEQQRIAKDDKIILAACCIGLVALVVMALLGALPGGTA